MADGSVPRPSPGLKSLTHNPPVVYISPVRLHNNTYRCTRPCAGSTPRASRRVITVKLAEHDRLRGRIGPRTSQLLALDGTITELSP
ncbi:hypothetical protein EVAR_91756_1 [Eumeta japonica]|uniref:Uncharacterized protein n=1 Tax=Eumeta variegata TaxID=151549 RepID=A0A4C1SIT9_EUMVA|nr:hypothetical protein EVAR_91756_1 [Eumeta japonica]